MSDDEDRSAILTRRRLLVASALSGMSLAAAEPAFAQPAPCLSRLPSPRARFANDGGRHEVRADGVPEVIRRQLEDGMIYAAGGGLTSRPWRIELRLTGSLWAGEGDTAGAASHGPLEHRWGSQPSLDDLRAIVALADEVWREAPTPNPRPTADYDEVLAMRDRSAYYFAEGYGALRGRAAILVARLRALAAAARPR